METTNHINLLGLKAKDVVTGLTGVITSISFDLYGCGQAIVTPEAKDGKIDHGAYFDLTRLEILSKEPVMQLPDFSAGYVAEGRKGCATKPLP